jgi:hypothetical protein
MSDSKWGSKWQQQLTPVLRQSQIIVAALIAGCVIFLVIALVMTGGKVADPDQPVLTYIAVGFVAVTLIARMIVPGMLIASGRQKIIRGTWQLAQSAAIRPTMAEFLERTGDAGKLAVIFNTITIVSGALLEAPAFFALVAYLVDQSPLSLVLAGLLILGLVTQVPTRSRLIHWIEGQLALLEQERQLGG